MISNNLQEHGVDMLSLTILYSLAPQCFSIIADRAVDHTDSRLCLIGRFTHALFRIYIN